MKSEKLFLNIEHNQQTSGDCSRTTREQLAWVVASWGSGKVAVVSGVGGQARSAEREGVEIARWSRVDGGALGGDWGGGGGGG